MTLTIEKKVTEEVDFDLSAPKYRYNGGTMYYKFEIKNGSPITTQFDTVNGFSLIVHNGILNHDALFLNNEYKAISGAHFHIVLNALLKENNLI